MPTASVGAPPARDRIDDLADVARQLVEHVGGDDEAPVGDRGRRALCGRADQRGRGVHREIDGGVEHAGGDQRHDRDEALGQHRAIADEAQVGLARDHLGRRAAGDQRVEARHRAAGDGDEQEREQLARECRAGAVDELRHRRHLQVGTHDQDAERQAGDHPDLEEGRQVIARRQQQPHRRDRGDKAVRHQDQRQRGARIGEHRRQGRRMRHRLAADDRRHQQDEADHRHFGDLAGTQEAAIKAHQHRDRDGRKDGEGAPRAAGQRLDHHQRQHREQDDHNHQHADQRDGAGDQPHFAADHVAQRPRVAAGGEIEDQEVLHRPGEHHAGQQPQRTGQIAHLCREHRADQRPRPGDGGEMVAEQHALVRRDIVEAVVAPYRRGRARRIDAQHARRDEQAVETIGDGIDAERCDHDPQRIDRFAAHQRDPAERDRADDRHRRPADPPADARRCDGCPCCRCHAPLPCSGYYWRNGAADAMGFVT